MEHRGTVDLVPRGSAAGFVGRTIWVYSAVVGGGRSVTRLPGMIDIRNALSAISTADDGDRMRRDLLADIS
jgi:hypothetical protein